MLKDLPLPGSPEKRACRRSVGRAEVKGSTEQRLSDLRFDIRLWKAQQYWEVR
jgi:hypothetical protein